MNNKHRNTEIPEYRNTGIPGKTKKQPDYRNTRLPTAFTLTELLMALAITALIGMSVVTVSTALSHAHSHSDSMIEAISSGRFAMMSIEADVRKAGLITGTGSGEMAVWTGDDNADGQINVAELILIRFDADQTVERLQVVFPDSMPPGQLAALNVSIPLANLTDTAFVRWVFGRARYSRYLSRRVLATGASNFEVVTDAAAPMSRLVLLRLAVGQGAQQITLTNSVRLRADATGSVEWSEGVPVLNL